MKQHLWATLCFVGLLACSPGDPPAIGGSGAEVTPGRYSILLVTLDTTRADHLEPYGAVGVETPSLSRLADRGIVFDHAVATAPVTGPTHASLLTGLYPIRHGVRNNLTHYLSDEIPTVTEWLSDAGYRTAAFVSAVVLEGRFGFDQGFDTYDDDLRSPGGGGLSPKIPERSAEATADRAIAWLDGLTSDQPFFLWVHFYDPHTPYSPPSPWAEKFRDRPYDGEIAYMDSQIGRLLQHPKAARDDVVIVAIGDHGEGLGDHGEQEHGLLIYESTIRVPWIMKLPRGPAGIRVAAPVSQVDLVPTILETVSLELHSGLDALEGRSLLPLLRGDDWTSDRLLFSETEVPFFSYGWARLRSVRQAAVKYIDAPVEELYELESDPKERNNLAVEREAATRRLAAEIDSWSARTSETDNAAPVDAETEAMLRALGYSAGDPGRPEGEGHGNPVELIAVHEELQAVNRLMVSGQMNEAVSRLRGVLVRDPDNLAALRELSGGLVKLGRLDEAAEVATRATAAAPWSSRALKAAADVEFRRGHHQQALDLIDRSLVLDGRFLEARLDRSRYLAALGRNVEARTELDGLLEESPENEWVALRYAENVELPAGDFRAAEDRLRAVLSQKPYFADGWLVLGAVLTRAGRAGDAVSVYTEAVRNGVNHPDLRIRLALLLADSADPGAENALRAAAGVSPVARADIHVALGEILAASGRRNEARQQFEIAARAPAFSAGTQNSKGMALMQLGRADEAEALWTDLIQEQPDYWRSWLNMSSLSLSRQQWAEAERYAQAAIEREPSSADAWNNLAIALEELGRTAEAEAAYRRAAEVDRSNYRALFNLGILLRKNARYNEAAAVQQQVLNRNPAHGGAHFELGILNAGPLGNTEQAKVHLRAAIAADPNHPRARQAQAVLGQLP
jgi:arylsulfatase A-like enzyme/Flp pilus assembly protein TadD